MRFFFRSRQFKIIVAVFSAVIIISLIFGIIGSRMSPGADIAGTLFAPLRSAATKVSDSVSSFFSSVNSNNELMLENEQLKSEISELRKQLAEYDNLAAKNEFYKSYLDIKEANPDFKFADATLISKDSDDPYGAFVISRGSLSGIHKYDPVITESGLVGYISEVGLTTAKVETILSPGIMLGALDSRTSDSGVVTGSIKLAGDGKCRFANLSRSCSVAIGDYIVTSGEGIFPEGLLIGTIESIGSDPYNTSIYAEITPFVDMSEIRGVMVITDFEGKGGIAVGAED